jgi:hypothetical protein
LRSLTMLTKVRARASEVLHGRASPLHGGRSHDYGLWMKVAVAIVLGAVGFVVLIIGLRDASLSADFFAREFGVVLILVGFVLMAPAVVLIFAHKATPIAFLIASLAALLVAILFVALVMTSGDGFGPSIPIVWFSVGAFVAAVAACVVWWPARREIPLPRIVQIAAIATFLIGLGQWWYTNQYLPSIAPPSLNITTKLERVGSTSTMLVYKGSISATNVTDARVRVLDSDYYVFESDVSPKRSPQLNPRAAASEHDDESLFPFPSVERFSRESHTGVVESGRIVPLKSWFEPNETQSIDMLVRIPKGATGTLQLYAKLYVVQGNALTFTTPLPARPTYVINQLNQFAYETVVWHMRIGETSWVRQFTRGDREVVVGWVEERCKLPDGASVAQDSQKHWIDLLKLTNSDGSSQQVKCDVDDRPLFPQLIEYIDREGRQPGRGSRQYELRLDDFYGAAGIWSATEESIP